MKVSNKSLRFKDQIFLKPSHYLHTSSSLKGFIESLVESKNQKNISKTSQSTSIIANPPSRKKNHLTSID